MALLLLTAAVAAIVAGQVGRREDELLAERSRELAGAIDRRTEFYIEKLYGIRAAFAADDRLLDHAEFDAFLRGQDFEERSSATAVVGLVEEVSDAEREAFVERVRDSTRASGLPYRPLTIVPPDRRPNYGVVSYVYPVTANDAVFGVDAYRRVGRRAAFARARDSAAPAAPQALPLPGEGPDGPLALTIALPVYEGRNQTPAPVDRFERFLGGVFLTVRLGEWLGGLAAPQDGEDLEIVDGGRVIFDARPGARVQEASRTATRTQSTAGRPWRVVFGTDGALVSSTERALPWLIAAFGLLVSLLAGAVIQALSFSRRRAEALADGMTEDLRRSNEELERFAFLASHDLQQPLRTISGFLQLLERQSGERLDDRGREYVGQALRGTRQMTQLIDDLLIYSRVTRDDRPLDAVALDQAWDAAVDQLSATIAQSGAEVSRSDLPVVAGDRSQLEQLFANLIANAVKYRGQDPPQVHADARPSDGVWEIAVQDNGIGIDPADHDHIFEMFRRLRNDDVEGTGVGLALALRIAERSGGDIRVDSEAGAGARFLVRLPGATLEGAA